METLVLHIPTLPIFFLMFLFIYLFAYCIIFRNWVPKNRAEGSSCFMSLAHGTPAVFLATHALLHSQTPRSFSHANTTSQNIVLDYSIAYFLADLLHYLVFLPNEVLFIAHHLATVFVFATCRYVVYHGAFPILVLLVIAEITSACQNTWILSKIQMADVPMAAKLYEFLRPIFFTFYSIARGVCGSAFVYKMGVYYVSGAADNVIPRWLWLSWMLVIVTATLVSILWILDLWMDLYRERTNKAPEKLR
ncbi:hypothetical protein L1049_006766 [Liquidambar formosana]|uniref:TLC domain-containing protein n=1 Tax=Liquidambar formosana TaxID=63359 RepID=A0AAP0RG60_LIQFO